MRRSDGCTPAPAVVAIMVIPAVAWSAWTEAVVPAIVVVVGTWAAVVHAMMWTWLVRTVAHVTAGLIAGTVIPVVTTMMIAAMIAMVTIAHARTAAVVVAGLATAIVTGLIAEVSTAIVAGLVAVVATGLVATWLVVIAILASIFWQLTIGMRINASAIINAGTVTTAIATGCATPMINVRTTVAIANRACIDTAWAVNLTARTAAAHAGARWTVAAHAGARWTVAAHAGAWRRIAAINLAATAWTR